MYPREIPNRRNVTAVILLELLGLILLSVLAALSTPHEGAGPRSGPGDSKARSSVAIVLGRWWHVFRIALLLAVAPGLIVLPLATAREFQPAIRVEDTTFGPGGTKTVMITTTTPSGETSRQLFTGDRSDANVQAALRELSVQHTGQLRGDRLRVAGLLMITILAHGAAATSAGLALALWVKRRRWRIAVAVGFCLLVTLAWPIGVFFVSRIGSNVHGLYALSPLWAAGYLMAALVNRQPHPSGLLWWVGVWDAVVTLIAIGLLYRAVRTLERRLGAENDGASPIPRPAFAQRLLEASRN